MKRIQILMGVLAILGSIGAAHASEFGANPLETGYGPDQVCFSIRQGFPVPFSTINRKVELADGETYTLVGWIRIRKGQPVFHVSLEDQPWLATKARKETPFYPVYDRESSWKKSSSSQKVRVIVRAEQRLGIIDGQPAAWIALVALSDPQPSR